MRKRRVNNLKDWEVELYEAARTNLVFYQGILDVIATGEPVIDADPGDITEDERSWRSFEFDVANDDEPPMDEELADLIQSDW